MNNLVYPEYSDNADISVINENFRKVSAAVDDAHEHAANKNNPHEVTAAQVGLGNVTNESKSTMFRNAMLTGLPTAPTANDNSNGKQIANVEFVKEKISASEEKQKGAYNSILSNYVTIKALEQSLICRELNTSVYAEIGADIGTKDTDSITTSANGTGFIDEDVTVTGIGGYPRSIAVSIPWKTASTGGGPFAGDYFSVQISFSDITLQGTIDALLNGYYSTVITLSQAAVMKSTKNTFTFHIKISANRSFRFVKKTSWGVSIPQTSYLISDTE